MKNKLLYLILFVSMFTTGHAQCELFHDSEISMDLYNGMDTFPKLTDTTTSEHEIIKENFKAPGKKYPETLRIRFIYIIEKDGTSIFKKLASPPNDKEMEDEVRRMVGLLPKYKPAMCDNNPVQFKVDIEFPISKKGSFTVKQGNVKN